VWQIPFLADIPSPIGLVRRDIAAMPIPRISTRKLPAATGRGCELTARLARGDLSMAEKLDPRQVVTFEELLRAMMYK